MLFFVFFCFFLNKIKAVCLDSGRATNPDNCVGCLATSAGLWRGSAAGANKHITATSAKPPPPAPLLVRSLPLPVRMGTGGGGGLTRRWFLASSCGFPSGPVRDGQPLPGLCTVAACSSSSSSVTVYIAAGRYSRLGRLSSTLFCVLFF